ncbi:MAG: glycosyltransferase family 4 protein [Bdellovibrionota bacterium]
MMVVHSCTSKSFSGLESYVLELVTWQNKLSKPVVLYCREESQLAREAERRGIPLWLIGPDEKPGPLLWSKMWTGWKERLRGGEVTLHMHAGGEPWFHLPWLAARSSQLKKAILHYHIWINHKKNDPLHRALFLGIDEVWTSSETARAHLATLLPIERKKIRVVPYGRDVRLLQGISKEQSRLQVRARFGLGEKDVLGICVSRLEPIKGVGELFEAFVKIAPEYPQAHLLIVGNASPNNPEAQRFSEGLYKRYASLEENVRRRLHLPGYESECLPIMAGADFYVLPSYEECMSLAMLDALILGLPIVGTNSGGTPSVARPDETGILVPPRNADALASALGRLYGDLERRRELGKGARALGPAFDREKIFTQIWEWYSAPVPSTMNA